MKDDLTTSCVLAVVLLPCLGWSAEDAGQRAVQQMQLQRQQQQDQLQLKMQQYQQTRQSPPADPRQRQAIEQLEINQAVQQQQLHERQLRAQQSRPELPSDDEGARRAKAQIEQQRARQESRQQLQQFDLERQQAGRIKDPPAPALPLPVISP